MALDARPASAPAPALAGGRGVEVVVAPAPPALAPGTELLGTLSGSGYRAAPGLVRRADGQTLQVTPLLYALLACLDGARDAEALADALGERTGRLVTAADVEQLLESRLRPQGLLADAAGSAPAVRRASPLLALRLKVVVTDPAVTARLTAPFAALFRPWVVLPVLVAFAATVWWALLERGLAGAAHQAFHEPGLLLLVFALTVASAGFHELGHAAACRYGGATPGAMGAGLYLVWPAFWTDVDDSYRLSRWGRLRVDLGGLYFNALVTVAVAAAALATGTDALLLVVATQLLQMARQLAPFVRADGYHLLADLTGVPDLFAHVKPTLLGLLPTRWGRPEGRVLRPWARVVVTAWVLVTVPLLIGLLCLLVVLLPRLVATAWSGLGAQSGRLAADLADGDVVMAAARLLGLLGLVFPAVAVSYLLARVVRRTALWVWRATEERPTGRLVTVCAAAFLGAVLAGAWWPSGQYRPVAAAPPPASSPAGAPALAAAAPVAAPAPSTAPAAPAGEAKVFGAPLTGAPSQPIAAVL
ncbi:MAG TPA: hypothetical protein VNU66_13470, partial [Mycobacteriales bacterium]|nr:hypothetical protein [Mycobacteriales bacterium]